MLRKLPQQTIIAAGFTLWTAFTVAPAYAQDQAAAQAAGAKYVPLSETLVYVIMAVIYIIVFVAVVGVINALSRKSPALPGERGWRLGDALSEEGEITGPGGGKQTVMLASSSRLIALLGMIVIMALFLGVGTIVIWELAETGSAPVLDGVLKYFLAGAGLFIPYSVNQIRSGFESIGKP